MDCDNDTDESVSSSVIKHFLNQYANNDFSYHERLAKIVHDICVKYLRDHMYDANVTYRAKTIESLTKKLDNRRQKDRYKRDSDIREKIVDISGVRIALFLPHQKATVNNFIEERFEILEKVPHPRAEEKPINGLRDKEAEGEDSKAEDRRKAKDTGLGRVEGDVNKEHPEGTYENRFKGYQATHYRVKLKRADVPRDLDNGDQIEIQVMSVLHSAWSEVEHNILYKRMKGEPSEPEKSMLDGLNGLVSIGELYLEQLNKIYTNRVEFEKDANEAFANEYELGSFLSSMMRDKTLPADKFSMSSVELLRKFLSLDGINLDSKRKLSDEIPRLNITANRESQPLSHFQSPQNPNISLVVMESIFRKDAFRLEGRVKQHQTRSDAERCKILMSTILSLDELFSPASNWMIELNKQPPTDFSTLKWLMQTQSSRNIVLDPREEVHPDDHKIIDGLWKWLQEHPAEIVKFVFSISRLGVLREFPQEFPSLRSIYDRSKGYMTEEYVRLASSEAIGHL